MRILLQKKIVTIELARDTVNIESYQKWIPKFENDNTDVMDSDIF